MSHMAEEPFVPEQHEAVIEADPKRPWKAYAGGGATAVAVFVTAWIVDTDPFTGKEIAGAALAAAAAGLPAFGIVFGVANPLRSRNLR